MGCLLGSDFGNLSGRKALGNRRGYSSQRSLHMDMTMRVHCTSFSNPGSLQRHCLLGGGRLRLRGNCHCHSNLSDGAHPPEETVARYRDAGYDFLYLTEHCDKLTSGKLPDFDNLDSPDFRVLPGVEYRATIVRYGRRTEAMILGLNTLELSGWRSGIDQQATIDAINADGGIAILSCTYWDGRSASDMVNLKGVAGIEIYNATCEGAVCKGNAVTHWDELLESGMQLYGLSVDDCHFSTWPDFALGWIVVCVEERAPTAIADAIRAGTFYSSCGPTIEEWSLQGTKITFRCSEVKRIACNSISSSGRVIRAPSGQALTGWVFDLSDDWVSGLPWLRFSCCDSDGRWAWTNPIWLGDMNQ